MPDDDEIIRKVQEAAGRYQPAYDEASWADMQRLLDEHLPQKKNKRRIIYFFLLALIPIILVYVAFEFNNHRTVPLSLTTASNVSQLKTPAGNQLKQSPVKEEKNITQIQQRSNIKNPFRQKSIFKITGITDRYTPGASLSGHVPLNRSQRKNDGAITAEISPANSAIVKTLDDTGTSTSDSLLAVTTTPDILNTDDTDTLQKSKQSNITKKVSKEDTSKTTTTAGTIKKDNSHFKHYWIIGAALGPDVSAVKLDNAGKITLQYGVQLGYAISQRFTLHTGFFISKKLYSVGANDYHAQGSYYNNYLQTVDADCKVYEIPLTLSYKFASTKKGGWFASAGLSSYFMKRESYDYFYKYPGGTTYTDNYTVSNKNKHYFSIIDFSAGYERTLNKKISISAEPYMKLPVTGIGVGKIKLNSAGILFSINVKPFR